MKEDKFKIGDLVQIVCEENISLREKLNGKISIVTKIYPPVKTYSNEDIEWNYEWITLWNYEGCFAPHVLKLLHRSE